MSPRSRSVAPTPRQLLSQVNKSYNKLVKEKTNKKSRSGSLTAGHRSPRSLQKNAEKDVSTSDYSNEGVLKRLMFIANNSLEQDRKLYKESKNNPVVLAYLQQKLESLLAKNNENCVGSLSEDSLLFATFLLRRKEQNSKRSPNGHMKDNQKDDENLSCLSEINVSEMTQPCSTSLDQVSQTQKVLTKEISSKPILSKGKAGPQGKGKKYLRNVCFFIFIINSLLLYLSLRFMNSDQSVENVRDVSILKNQTDIGNKIIDLNEEERLISLNLEFQKLNQDLQAFAENMHRPKEKSSNLQNLFSYSAVAISLQVILLALYFMYQHATSKSSRKK
jgi:hypothetical protein